MSTPARKKAQRQAELAKLKKMREWESLRATKTKKKKEFKELTPNDTYRRESPEYSSLKTTQCNTAKRESDKYTGDYITGITIVHKSGLAPVSRGIDPKDYATMRR